MSATSSPSSRVRRLLPFAFMLLVLVVPVTMAILSQTNGGESEDPRSVNAGVEDPVATEVDPALVRGELVAGGDSLLPLEAGGGSLRVHRDEGVRGKEVFVVSTVGSDGLLIAGNERDRDRVYVRLTGDDPQPAEGDRVALTGTVRSAQRADDLDLSGGAADAVRVAGGYVETRAAG